MTLRILIVLISCLNFIYSENEPQDPLEPYSIQKANEWKKRVYLASYPRSGNHWIRYLLEEVTGLTTSSVYQDPEYGTRMFPDAFPWGGYGCIGGYHHNCRFPKKDELTLIKTHFPVFTTEFDLLPYKMVVRIVRHPIDSLFSYHIYNPFIYPPHQYVEQFIPKEKLIYLIDLLLYFENFWDQQPNVLTIRYEDLYTNPKATIKKILRCLSFSVTNAAIEDTVSKYPPTGGLLKHLSHYTEEDLMLIYTKLGTYMHKYGYEINKVRKI